ncbi:MAG TPA: stage II sporulation protein M [Steroidobacteraceae bacterium]|nr:stage II sporulation protein M [Steroidobacteraceae bacterium]
MATDTREQALRTALLQRADAWKAAAERARRLTTHRTGDVNDAAKLVDDYRLLAHDLARARRLMPESRARSFLESAYAQAHAALFKPASHPGYALWSLFRDQIPEAVRLLRPHIIWVSLLFVTSVLVGGWLVHTYPELINLFASPDLIATVERGELWTEGLLNVVPSSVLSLQILTNNIVVSLFAYCAGFLFGLGTFYIVGLNGLMLGGIFVFTAQHGLDGELFRFIVAHGCVELSVMVLSGAAGAAVGEALIRPTTPRRGQSFQLAAMRSGKVMVACVVLLVGCGFIEGYVSPNPEFPMWTRVIVGVGYWLFMIALLRGWLFGRSRSATPIEA